MNKKQLNLAMEIRRKTADMLGCKYTAIDWEYCKKEARRATRRVRQMRDCIQKSEWLELYYEV